MRPAGRVLRWVGGVRCAIGSMGLWLRISRWLAGYQHPWCMNTEVAKRLVEVFATPRRNGSPAVIHSLSVRSGDGLGRAPFW